MGPSAMPELYSVPATAEGNTMRHSRPAWQPCMPLEGTLQINMEHTAPRLQPVVVWVPLSSDQPVSHCGGGLLAVPGDAGDSQTCSPA